MKYKTKPMKHQRKMLRFHVKRNRSCEYSEQGTGKTKVAIDLIVNRMEHDMIRKTLVVCPASLTHNWGKEIELHSDLSYCILTGSDRADIFESKINDYDVFIISYSSFSLTDRDIQHGKAAHRIVDIIKETGCIDQLVLDEAHFVKSLYAGRTKAVHAVSDRIKYVLVMTATPIPNKLEDVWAIDYITTFGMTFTRNFYKFRNRYFYRYRLRGKKFNLYRPKSSLMKEVRKFVKTHGIRMLKKDCLDIPEKMYYAIEVPLTGKQLKAYKDICEGYNLDEFNFNLPPHELARYEVLSQICCGFIYDKENSAREVINLNSAKENLITEMIEGWIYSGKVIIYCKYRYELQRYKEKLKEYKPLMLYGGIANKQKVVDTFQNDESRKVILVQTSLGIGITLTAAKTVVYASNTYNYADRVQSEDRAHRIGQTDKVSYYDIVAITNHVDKTIDQRVLDIIRQKHLQAQRILGRET